MGDPQGTQGNQFASCHLTRYQRYLLTLKMCQDMHCPLTRSTPRHRFPRTNASVCSPTKRKEAPTWVEQSTRSSIGPVHVGTAQLKVERPNTVLTVLPIPWCSMAEARAFDSNNHIQPFAWMMGKSTSRWAPTQASVPPPPSSHATARRRGISVVF